MVKWGLIGCGDVMEAKNGPGLYKNEFSCVNGVYSRTYSKAQDYAKRHGIAIVYKTAEDLLADSNINAIYIATPPNSHLKYALMAIEHKKMVCIEKPLAGSYEEGEIILNKSKQEQVPVYISYYRRGLEKFLFIKKMIDENVIGKPLFGSYAQELPADSLDLNLKTQNWRLNGSISNGGKFVDMGCHVLDIFQFFMGKMIKVQGFASNHSDSYLVEDSVIASFMFENDFTLNGSWSFIAPQKKEEAIIVGERGKISFDILENHYVDLETSSTREHFSFKHPNHIGMPFQKTIIQNSLSNQFDISPLEDALNNLKIIDTLLARFRLENNIDYHPIK